VAVSRFKSSSIVQGFPKFQNASWGKRLGEYKFVHMVNNSFDLKSQGLVMGTNEYYTSGRAGTSLIVSKYAADGSKIWSNTYQVSSATTAQTAGGMAIDSTKTYLYVVGCNPTVTNGNFITKLNTSDGSVVWTQIISPIADYVFMVGLDSNDNLHLQSYRDPGDSTYKTVIFGIDKNGTKMYERTITGLMTSTGLVSNVVGNVITIGGFARSTYAPAGNNILFYCIYDINGNILTNKQTASGNSDVGLFGVQDKQGYILTGGYTGSSAYTGMIHKSISDGTMIYQYNITGDASTTVFMYGACSDSQGNSYFTGYVNSGSTQYAPTIFKFNAAGTLQWQRRFTAVSTSIPINIVSVNDSYVIVNCNYGDGTYNRQVNLMLPADGTGTGTYTVNGLTLVYAASSATVTASSRAFSTSSLSSSATTIYSFSSGTLTKTTASNTETKVALA